MDGSDLRERRQTWSGYGDALSRAIEMVVTPLLFGLGGWYLDRWLGTRPLFTLTLFLLAVVGMAARMYYAYAAAMEEHDRVAIWSRHPGPAGPGGHQPGEEQP